MSARILTAALVVLSLAGADAFGQPRSTTPPAERRIALLIGNGDYPAAPLRNPANDARSMAQALGDIGFDVMFLENVDQRQMRRAIIQFGDRIREGGIGLFFYAGHGMQVGGRNYMIPVDADVKSEAEVEADAVDVATVLARMETARNKLNIVILDACRDNPFVRRFRSTAKGLASIDAPVGTLIAYATAPGSVALDGTGANSFYTGALVEAIKTPGLRVEEVFKRVRQTVRVKTQGKQIPWEASSLEGEFVFIERRETAAPRPAPESDVRRSPPPAAPAPAPPPPPAAATPAPSPTPSAAPPARPPSVAAPVPAAPALPPAAPPAVASIPPDTGTPASRDRAAALVREALRRRGELRHSRAGATIYERYEINEVSVSGLSLTVHRMISGGNRTLDGKQANRRIEAAFDKIDQKTTRFNRGGSWSGARNAVDLCFETKNITIVGSDSFVFPTEQWVCLELAVPNAGAFEEMRIALELLSGKALPPVK
jgi:Caspase domain